ncbi:uncharacterized protein V1516DRAFT_515592 [Lipomyces oligophaga]|uniref:uncharacterized protein n=1 Tax=Lipomyces oligophaga TaxID=45792 RepID=UPI0034CEF696
MTRTVRSHSLSNSHSANLPVDNVPRLFGKSGTHAPFKAKKNGAGKGNWGREGDELEDIEHDYNFNPQIQHRRSNSNGGGAFGVFKRPSLDATANANANGNVNGNGGSKFGDLYEEVFEED